MAPSSFKNVDTFYSDKNIKNTPQSLNAHYIDPVHLNKRIFSERFLDSENDKVRLMKE